MSTISFAAITIAILVISMMFFIFKSNIKATNKKAYLLSKVAVALIILNWIIYMTVLYLTDFYIVIPGKLGDLIFFPIWFIVSILGLIAAYKEFRNNKNFSIFIFGLAIINSIIGMILWGISNI